ncbi:MAG: hypothetical protein GX593_02090 [Actinomycetales bacterium]|nr:hypothetical protein [Actinomycetales bacterium]
MVSSSPVDEPADDGAPVAPPVEDGTADDGELQPDPARDGQPGDGEPSGDAPADRARTVPSREELDRIAVDVHIRRRPRYGVFVAMGMIVAGVAALVWTTRVPQETHANWGATVWVTTLGAVAFGALIGAGVAVFADWRSRRQR